MSDERIGTRSQRFSYLQQRQQRAPWSTRGHSEHHPRQARCVGKSTAQRRGTAFRTCGGRPNSELGASYSYPKCVSASHFPVLGPRLFSLEIVAVWLVDWGNRSRDDLFYERPQDWRIVLPRPRVSLSAAR